jgi:mono/diheme cytochrome c family protein
MKKANAYLSTAFITAPVAVLAIALTASGWAQFKQDKGSPKIDVGKYPAEVQKDFGVYEARCSSCHALGTISRTLRAAPTQQQFWIDKMKAMPSTDFSDKDAKRILAFLSYDASHHASGAEAENATVTNPNVAGAIAAGRQFFKVQSCSVCHAIAGEGGSVGPALDNVGRVLTPEKLTQKMMALRSGSVGSMPPLPSTTTNEQIQSLVAYLSSLKGNQ